MLPSCEIASCLVAMTYLPGNAFSWPPAHANLLEELAVFPGLPGVFGAASPWLDNKSPPAR